ncbi:gliding motility-associated C-terminal domain-containing protein [Robiginitalea sp. SC105]|uniref:gliding motility-associated C-terminal domain-containing protein n=1 Tax=Robiginitalea sp. SC105 TaxID=2762332 RepID=UPI002102D105|nr:gliding motility-associated C-terminal domain-containing protein [Robiginitalea sp. SC105]
MRLHGEGAAGMHANFNNEGSFENQQGLVGFYNDNGSLVISGSRMPVFYDTEFSAANGIWLKTPLQVLNNANLIQGDIRTARDGREGYPQFDYASFYTGENRVSKVDGYAAILNKQEFTFPIGNPQRLRPLTIESQAINARAGSAYYPEDPGMPLSTSDNFDPSAVAEPEITVSREEFWTVDGDIPSKVTLTWDEYSNVSGLARFYGDLRVVGWNREKQAWENLGNTHVEGGRDYGSLTSDYFVPSQYGAITFGGTYESGSYRTVELDNYYLSPNGDGVNETLEIEAARESPRNNLQVYNRYGALVYQKDNYTGDFDGKSNTELVVRRQSGLEPGIYFYIITFPELQERHQGYFYLNN